MGNHKIGSKVPAEAQVALTKEQINQLKELLEDWREDGGLVVASLILNEPTIDITFKLVPEELGKQIIEIVDDFYKGETDVNSWKIRRQ